MAIKVKMTKTTQGVDAGSIYPKSYDEGKTYVIGEDLARAFKGMDVCKLIGEADEASAPKDPPPAPEKDITKMNKAELTEVAQGMGLVFDESATKKDLIELIEASAPKE